VDRPLTEEERRYPIGPHFPNVPLLIDWIEKRYRTGDDDG